MVDQYPTKKVGLPPEYEPPSLNTAQSSAAQGSYAIAYSSDWPAGTAQPPHVVTDAAGNPVDATPRPASSHSMSVYPASGYDNQVVITGKSIPRKSLPQAYCLGIPLGMLGTHHFYLRRGGFGTVYLFTLGLMGVGWVADWFRMPWLLEEANRCLLDPKQKDKKSISDAYVLWFPFGLLGFHHYYLGNWVWGLAYTFSFGLFGIGWLIDAVRIPSMVKAYNEEREQKLAADIRPVKRLGDAYILGATPMGFLGAHHYYLERYLFGVTYTFTLGLFGVGWLVDLFRMTLLVERANKAIREGDDRLKHLDDAYVLCFPLGFLGLHHFYLHRHCWGFLYLCTVGLFGVGWVIDWFRLPWLVKAVNEKIREENRVVDHLRTRMGPNAQVVFSENAVIVRNASAVIPAAETGAGGSAHDVGLSAQGEGGTEVNPSQEPAMHLVDDPHGQILQPPSYDSVFGEGASDTMTKQTTVATHSMGAAGTSQDSMPGVETVNVDEKAGPLPNKTSTTKEQQP